MSLSILLFWFIFSISWTHVHKNVSDIVDLGCYCGVPENAEYKLNTDDNKHDDEDDHHTSRDEKSDDDPGDDDDLLLSERVIGGEISRRDRYPWTVRVVWVCLGPRGLLKVTTCSASLVTPKLLASATHCFSESPERLTVSLTCSRSSEGELAGQLMVDTGVNSANVPDKGKLYKIKKIIAGEGHCPFSDFGDSNCADFCLILLQRPITFTKLLRPICLPDPDQDFSGMKTTSIGWGMFKVKEAKVSTKKLHSSLDDICVHVNLDSFLSAPGS